jgi:flagellar biosynthetic protein FliR
MVVFVRVGAMFAMLPIFSIPNLPLQVRIALGAMVAFLVAATLPPIPLAGASFASIVGLLLIEGSIGLLLGFIVRLLFFALDAAGNVIATEMGLMLASDFNPFNNARSEAPSMVLYLLGITMFLSLDLHQWLLMGLQRSYQLLPPGGAHLSDLLFSDILGRTSRIFVVAIQIAAPVMAVSFIITLVFSVLGRAVPQMNVFAESFAFRTLAGLGVFGLSLSLMAQHIVNYLRALPEDVLRVAQLLGGT